MVLHFVKFFFKYAKICLTMCFMEHIWNKLKPKVSMIL